jgi:uncharacterized membrane protein
MNQPNNNKPETLLHWWLAVATNGLAPAGKERLTREISLHYAEAVEAHLAQDESERTPETKAIAECTVIKELGEPEVAARHFRKIYWTGKETEHVANLVKVGGKTPILLLGLLIPAILLGIGLFLGPLAAPLIFGGLVLMLAVCPAFTFMLAKRPLTKASTSLLLLADWTRDIALAVAAPIMVVSPFRNPGLIVGIVVLVVLVKIIPRIRIWNKARKMSDEFDETTGIAT